MPNYSKALIYKLVCKDVETKECYVGSTTNYTNRKNFHKNACKNKKVKAHNAPVYKFIRENGGIDNWDMVIIQNYPCNTKLELLERERYFIEQLNSELNNVVPVRTSDELKELRKERDKKREQEIKKYQKNYYEKHQETAKKNREERKEELKRKRKIYNEQHKLEIKEYQAKYYKQHKNIKYVRD